MTKKVRQLAVQHATCVGCLLFVPLWLPLQCAPLIDYTFAAFGWLSRVEYLCRYALLDVTRGDQAVWIRLQGRHLEFGHHVHRNGYGRTALCRAPSHEGSLLLPANASGCISSTSLLLLKHPGEVLGSSFRLAVSDAFAFYLSGHTSGDDLIVLSSRALAWRICRSCSSSPKTLHRHWAHSSLSHSESSSRYVSSGIPKRCVQEACGISSEHLSRKRRGRGLKKLWGGLSALSSKLKLLIIGQPTKHAHAPHPSL